MLWSKACDHYYTTMQIIRIFYFILKFISETIYFVKRPLFVVIVANNDAINNGGGVGK